MELLLREHTRLLDAYPETFISSLLEITIKTTNTLIHASIGADGNSKYIKKKRKRISGNDGTPPYFD